MFALSVYLTLSPAIHFVSFDTLSIARGRVVVNLRLPYAVISKPTIHTACIYMVAYRGVYRGKGRHSEIWRGMCYNLFYISNEQVTEIHTISSK